MTGPARAAWDKASTRGTRPAGELELIGAANRALAEQDKRIARLEDQAARRQTGLTEAGVVIARLRAELTGAQVTRLASTDLAMAKAADLQRDLTEARTVIARLRAELDQQDGTTVLHCMDRVMGAVMDASRGAPDGTVIRATDTGREIIHRGGAWLPREGAAR